MFKLVAKISKFFAALLSLFQDFQIQRNFRFLNKIILSLYLQKITQYLNLL